MNYLIKMILMNLSVEEYIMVLRFLMGLLMVLIVVIGIVVLLPLLVCYIIVISIANLLKLFSVQSTATAKILYQKKKFYPSLTRSVVILLIPIMLRQKMMI